MVGQIIALVALDRLGLKDSINESWNADFD